MSNLEQYLYEYKDGKKTRNLGLMKVEENFNQSLIRVYAKELDHVVGIMFRRPDGEIYFAGWNDEFFQKDSAEPEGKQEDDYITPRGVIYEKIQRQDLSRLPRKEWRLANNSFLLHGFYNYHHLLYMEEDGNVWIGVPGIFHEKEEQAAKSFGFPTFRRLIDREIQLDENETNLYEDFGYWCRQISGV